MSAEQQRLEQSEKRTAHWKRWGPYVSERAWSTVREDYSADGNAWAYFPHEHARSRAYRWNEDGLAGICDRHQFICFGIALWNGRDRILKERPFGLTGPEGNHGEDLKEYYFYLDSTPTHSYMKFLYKYPQGAFPYSDLVAENGRRMRKDPEYELLDTGIFVDNRYFDVFVEYAKASPEDILCRITIANRGPDQAVLHLLPTIWFRNRWTWGRHPGPLPRLHPGVSSENAVSIAVDEPHLGPRTLIAEGQPELLFVDNETNLRRLFGRDHGSPYPKDGINDRVVHGRRDTVNPALEGSKASAWYQLTIDPDATTTVRLRLSDGPSDRGLGNDFDAVFASRIREADEFYDELVPANLSAEERAVVRQAFAGLLWSKQFYHYVIRDWLDGDPVGPPPPPERLQGRNTGWPQLYNADVISMPDKWEYPWYAAWDLAFHCIPMAVVDPEFAKDQLVLMLREWYMHPSGQLPAYEWAFDDVNPPVHAWATWRVYRIEKRATGRGDRLFLERVFQKLLINFTWWVNRKDAEGNNVFEGGFLGLDNVGLFDRSKPLPTGGLIEQSDGTSWMGMYTLNMLAMALELAVDNPAYEDVASKFWEHFLYIAQAMNNIGPGGSGLWNEEDGFFYDVLRLPDGEAVPLRSRSVVGLIPLFAVETLEPGMLERFPAFKRRMEWFLDHRPDLTGNVASMRIRGDQERRLLSFVTQDQLRRVLSVMLDEREFLSPFGIRALSRVHLDHPYVVQLDGMSYTLDYEPAESTTALFGGNSNWRGPVWFPINYLIIEALQRHHHYYGDGFRVECPTGSGRFLTLDEVATELSQRLTRIFLPDKSGRRPVRGALEIFHNDPHWSPYLLFHEYFHGDNGTGLGASHQTGWTGLVAKLLLQSGGRKVKATGKGHGGAPRRSEAQPR
ncbi:MAG TPA: hypothetical protein VHI99_14010 [Vicinamibacterales bacterium]|nr:hypothetical protein [Vicinamibacterales bacterium]